MRRALAMGADRGIRIDGEEIPPGDPITTAGALANVVRGESPDLVLCGVQSSDAVQGATGAALAELLALPRVAVAKKVELQGGKALVHRELEGGLIDVTEVDLPAVLTIQTGINEPRYATLRAIKQAEQQEIEVVEPGDLGAPAARVPPDVRAAEGRGRGAARKRPVRDRRPDQDPRRGEAAMSVLVVAEHINGGVRDVTPGARDGGGRSSAVPSPSRSSPATRSGSSTR